MEVQVSAAKVGKYATSTSGDSLEMVERPGGGLSLVLVDGQRSGKAAKNISNVVSRKTISLLGEGIRDGAAARAASDYLHTYRSGKVTATLNILSIDLDSRTLVITRNNPSPVMVVKDEEIDVIDGPSEPVGTRRGIRPEITEMDLIEKMAIVVYTDGLVHAGTRTGTPFDVIAVIRELIEADTHPNEWADRLLSSAVELDDGRPTDDISVLVVSTHPKPTDDIRRLRVQMPL